jgi:hypothetical protein
VGREGDATLEAGGVHRAAIGRAVLLASADGLADVRHTDRASGTTRAPIRGLARAFVVASAEDWEQYQTGNNDKQVYSHVSIVRTVGIL